MTKKKKILFHSNHSKAFTGFGKNCKNVLKYLQSTGKYEIIEAANGFTKSNPKLNKMPWKCFGTLPDDQARMNQISKDPSLAKSASYGNEMIDSLIKEIQPDIYIGAEDAWAFDKYWEKKWWNNIETMVWTTLDSEPILPLAIELAKNTKHFYSWASFAEREMHKLGHKHAGTMRGIVDDSHFFKGSKDDRDKLRKAHNIDSNCFLIGFVFRNQLRKSVPNLLDGFQKFKAQNPSVNAKLLLHTHWGEGWDIPRLIKEKGINNRDVLTTYFCSKCQKYQIRPFDGQEKDCKFCGSKKTLNTTNVTSGVSESQLNEIYNMMDVYCHPFTSGGQEIPIQEAKLCELITLVTNYSCGEDHCTPQSGGFPLDWTEYREPGTQFIKASTSPYSISKQLTKVLKMKPNKRAAMGKKARDFVIEHYSPSAVGKKIEKIIDEAPFCDWDFDFSEKERNSEYTPPVIESDSLWLIDIYKNILNMDVDPKSDKGHAHWMNKIKEGTDRNDILEYFQKIAQKENQEITQKTLIEDLLDDEGPDKRIAVVMPESAGDVLMVNSLMSNLKSMYPDHNIYFATKKQFYPLIEDNPYIHKVIPYSKSMDNIHFMEGQGNNLGYFNICYLPYAGTQRFITYPHNGNDKNQFNLMEPLLKGIA